MNFQKKIKLFKVLSRNALMEYLRDPIPVMFTFAMPLIFFFVFGVTSLIVNFNVAAPQSWNVGLIDQAQSEASASYAESLGDLPGIQVEKIAAEVEGMEMLEKQQLSALVVIPQGWQADLSNLKVLTQTQSSNVIELALQAADGASDNAQSAFEMKVETISAEGNSYFQFLMPGLIAMSLLQLGLYGTATPVLTSKQSGEFRSYSLTPMPADVLMVSHIFVRVLVAFLQISLLVLVGTLMLGLKSPSSLLLLFAVTITGSAVMISFGYFLGGFLGRVQTGLLLVLGLNFYLLLFGQVFADFSKIPILNWLIYANPMSYIADSYRQLFVEQYEGMLSIPTNLLIITAWMIFFIVLIRFTFTFSVSNSSEGLSN